MHRKILLALAVLAFVFSWMAAGPANAQGTAPAVPTATAPADPNADNPFGDTLTFSGFIKRTGITIE